MSPTIQYSPSLARRLKIGVSEARDREREKASIAGTRRTVAGSSCGNQTSGVLSACRCGAKGKPHSPAKSERVDVCIRYPVSNGVVISFVRAIAPKVLPRKLSPTEFVHIGVRGRRPPIGCRRHRVVSTKRL